ncbi:MAG: hypothetical protein VW397_01680 [Candidatus Margulisiibacteriota bacterium]
MKPNISSLFIYLAQPQPSTFPISSRSDANRRCQPISKSNSAYLSKKKNQLNHHELSPNTISEFEKGHLVDSVT